MSDYSAQFLSKIEMIKNKRAKIVITHILQHGFISTEDLKKYCGYNHPPRAIRDVREIGIPLETFKMKSSEGKTIAAYRFGDLSKITTNQMQGRKVFSKSFKTQLYQNYQSRCSLCHSNFEMRYLQIDHRIPYEICQDNKDFQKDVLIIC